MRQPFAPTFHLFPVKTLPSPPYNEGVVLMKKTQAMIAILTVLLAFSLLFVGCDRGISAEISEQNEDDLLPPTDESFPPPLSIEPSEDSPVDPDDLHPDDPPDPLSDHPEESIPIDSTTVEPPDRISESAPHGTYLAACATANLNVRMGAGAGYPVLFTLKRGDSLPFLERAGEWIKVTTERGIGYLYGAYAYLAETTESIERVIRAGLAKLGTPYQWGAPRILTDTGEVSRYFTGNSFDCSSFVQYCYYIGCGIKLGNYTGSQADYTVGEKIHTYSSLRRGDFYFTGTDKIAHVVIYLGGGYLLQTYSAYGGPVSITTDERWRGKFLSGRRPDMSVIVQYK